MTKRTKPDQIDLKIHSSETEPQTDVLSDQEMPQDHHELQYEKIYQSIADAVFVIRVEPGPVFRYIDSNPFHAQWTGIPSEVLKNKTPHELLSQPIAMAVEANYQRCYDLKSTIVYEETLDLPRDRRTWQTTLTPFVEAGEVRYIIGSATDVSELRTVANAYQVTHEQFESFFNLSPDLLCIVDQYGKYAKVNAAWESILGYTVEEVQNALFYQFVHPMDLEMSLEILGALTRGETVKGFVNRLKSKSGSYRYIEWNAQPSGQYIYASARDITLRKENEDHLVYLNFHDALTGLYNRAYYEDALKRLDVARNLPITVITVDVNGLKLVNDTFGHLEGDSLLKLTAEVLSAACRSEDIIARVGGDEFSIILPKTDAETASQIADRIRTLAHASRTDVIMLSLALGEATKMTRNQVLSRILKDSETAMYHNKLLESRWSKNALIESIAALMEDKAHNTMDHCRRVQKLCETFGSQLGLTREKIRDLSLLALMHDIGIMSVPNEIVEKPALLSEEERYQIRKHSESGYRIAISSPDFARIADDILSHHERWDGAGYPRGLSRRDIPLLARIVSIIEAFDTMKHDQIYRHAFSDEHIRKELLDGAGTQFDPHLTHLFLKEIFGKALN